MSMRVINIEQQAKGNFNGGQILENKPVGFPQDGGFVRPYTNLFYWARARGVVDSTIGLHPHQGFEILTFVLKGNIRHFDTKMNAWKPLTAGDVQIIRAGNGIQHAEHLEKDSEIFQIWFDPNLNETLRKEASYSDYRSGAFPVEDTEFGSTKTLIGTNSPLELDTPGLQVERYRFDKGGTLELPAGKVASIYILDGAGQLNGKTVVRDDFVILEEVSLLEVEPAESDSLEMFAIYTPVQLDYKTYWERQTRYA